MPEDRQTISAIRDFRQARQRAALSQVMARLTGRSVDLLSYDDVTARLRTVASIERGRQDIPIAAIAGSVGRYADFTRDFLPRRDSSQDRWTQMRTLTERPGSAGLPPIQVYKVGESYFIVDGHHRVSVARQLGATHIQAHVTEVQIKVPLSAGASLDEVILKSEMAELLETTELDRSRPEADLIVTEPGQAGHLMAAILAQQRALTEQRAAGGGSEPRPPEQAPAAAGSSDVTGPVQLPQAATDWYDNVYLPVVGVIREQGLLRDFPGRTETDLYVFIARHRAALEDELGWKIRPEVGATHLFEQQLARRSPMVQRAGRRLLSAVVPEELQPGPAAGRWRRERLTARYSDRLIADILVPVSGAPGEWYGLDQAIHIARRERAALYGLHMVATEAQKQNAPALAVRDEFTARCAAAGVVGRLAIEVGEVARKVCERAPLADLVVLNLAHPPSAPPLSRLGSGFRTILRRCPRPVLAVPEACLGPDRVVLAYDGSAKAEEALFVATYVAEAWQAALAVVIIQEGTTLPTGAGQSNPLEHVRAYMDIHEVTAEYIVRSGQPMAAAVVETADTYQANLIAMGGYGSNSVVGVVVGSAVDQVLREVRRPVLVCC